MGQVSVFVAVPAFDRGGRSTCFMLSKKSQLRPSMKKRGDIHIKTRNADAGTAKHIPVQGDIKTEPGGGHELKIDRGSSSDILL